MKGRREGEREERKERKRKEPANLSGIIKLIILESTE